jgi:lipopolysaccharide export system permease protein
MAMLQLPDLGQKFLAFGILFGGVFTFVRLSRNRELVATRAAGVSAWDFLAPPLVVALAIGILTVTVFTPVSAAMFNEFSGLEARYIKGQDSMLTVLANGLWLRQGDERQQSVIHAQRVAAQGQHLEDVTVFLYSGRDVFAGRIDAASGDLENHAWRLTNAWVSDVSGKQPVHHATYEIATTLTPTQIQSITQAPDTQSFWDLPGFIRDQRASGFSANKYQLYLEKLYALPFLLAAMVFMAASFTLRIGRDGGVPKVILFSAACGFGVYFFDEMTRTMGEAGAVPVWLAASAPAVASILIGMTLLFNLEDG